MVVVMEERATETQIEQVVARLVEMGMDVHRSTGVTRTVLGVVGQGRPDAGIIELLDGVHEVLRISEPYKLASRTFKPEGTVVNVGDVRIGGDEVIVMAGPCSAESEKQVRTTAAAVRRAGAKIFRGGAFKPRSSPYSFQGLGEEGLRMLRDACNAENMQLVTEVMDVSQIEVIEQVRRHLPGRRAQHAELHAAARARPHARKPVLLKRGISATIEEWLLSAEYVLSGGNNDVILCERGIRTFETATRNTFDISAIPGRQEAEPPADHRRSEPRRGAARHGGADGAGGGRGRRRRPDHRGALRSRSRAERRRAVDVPGAVRSADGGAADHRAGDRPQHLSRTGGAPRLGLLGDLRLGA